MNVGARIARPQSHGNVVKPTGAHCASAIPRKRRKTHGRAMPAPTLIKNINDRKIHARPQIKNKVLKK